jgi:hypothetical protein
VTEEVDHPCRLFAIIARRAKTAVILRRGPSRHVRLSLWHTATDTFEHGQWFIGRLYQRRCDLSPDGSLFIYFAAKHGRPDPDYAYSWTAISKPPYFTALALWPKGDAWHGGGLFLNAKTVWLNHHPCQADPHPAHRPRGLRIEANPHVCGEDGPIYYKRLERDGWDLVNEGIQPGWNAPTPDPPTWHKPAPNQKYHLAMQYMGYFTGAYGDPHDYRYALVKSATGEQTPLEGATWAGWDHRGRLAFTRDGKLYAVPPQDFAPDIPPIADFNGQMFENIPPPRWARHW